MTSSVSKSTSFRWELKDFYSQFENNRDKDIVSDSFNVGSVSFALFYNTTFYGSWGDNSYGVILTNLGNKQSVEVSLKLWFENDQGQKFQENSIEKCVFNKAEDRCRFNVQKSGNDWCLFWNVANYYNKTLYICCEVTDLNHQTTVQTTDSIQKFLQNAWLAYEQELHDAVIKVGNTDFKILKTLFMIQSDVFKQMFTLKFKERETSTVEINDISEQTMKQLIKWVYTCQIENENVVEDLFEAADKYQVNLLKTDCVKLMISSLDNSNVFRRLILAIAHNNNQLKDAVLDYIIKIPNNEAMIYLTSSEWIEFAQKKSVFVKEVNKLLSDKLKK